MSRRVHAVCPHCHAVNAFPEARLGDAPSCGRCHSKIFAGHPVELAQATFDKHLTQNDIPVIVDFWAPWCGPCKTMAPEYERAALELEPQFRLAKLDTQAEPAFADRFAIRGIPTLIMFTAGREVARRSGAMRAADIVAWARDAAARRS